MFFAKDEKKPVSKTHMQGLCEERSNLTSQNNQSEQIIGLEIRYGIASFLAMTVYKTYLAPFNFKIPDTIKYCAKQYVSII